MKSSFLLFGAFALCLAQSASAAIITYSATLNGASENPPVVSAGTGSATVTINTTTNMMQVVVNFSGLTSGTTASHIHCCTTVAGSGSANVATTTPTFAGFPLGVTSGTYNQTFDLTQASSYNPAFVTANGSIAAAEAALLAGMAADKTYLNIHTSNNPGGEISGFLVPAVTPTPEPTTSALMGMGALLSFVGLKRFRRS